jgi:hypothetical protein
MELLLHAGFMGLLFTLEGSWNLRSTFYILCVYVLFYSVTSSTEYLSVLDFIAHQQIDFGTEC